MASRCSVVFLIAALLVSNLSWGREESAGYRRTFCQTAGISNRFDSYFRRAVRRSWPIEHQHEWCKFKAQCFVESGLRTDVASHAGAVGLCQIMPATWTEIAERPQLGRRHPAANVEAGARYMAKMLKIWYAPRTPTCRMELAQASYNAGAGHIIKAQKRSGGKRCWDGIQPHLWSVTGRHSIETTNYVKRIQKAHRRLRGQ